MTRKAYQLWHNGWRSSEDCTIALQAAQAMFKRLRVDIAIMPNLSVVPLRDVDLSIEQPLEIISSVRREL